MIDSVSSLLNQLEDQLKFIDLEQDDAIKCAQLSIDVSRKAVEKLKNIIPLPAILQRQPFMPL